MSDDKINVIRANLLRSIPNLCETLGYVNPAKQGNMWRYGTHGSLCITVSGRDAGAWYDHQDQNGGHVFELIMHRFGYSFAEAMKWSKSWLGEDIDSGLRYIEPVMQSKKIQNPNKKIAMRVWDESVDIKGTIGHKYLLGRGIEILPKIDVIRFNSKTKYIRYEGKKKIYDFAPAIILLVRDIETSEPVAIQRRFLDESGNKHPNFSKSVSLGRTKGAAIMLTPKTDSFGLNVCEGFEDGLSNMELGFLNMWVLLGTSGISKFPILDEVEWLRVISDPDKVGLRKAEDCVNRWKEAGKRAEYKTPPHNLDSNLYLQYTKGLTTITKPVTV